MGRQSSICLMKWNEMKSLSCDRLFGTPWTVAYQGSPFIGFSRQEYWSGLPFPSPGDLPDPGIEPRVSGIVGRHFTVWVTFICLMDLIMPFPTWSPAMGSHYLCVSVLVAQSCLTLSNPMDDSLPGSSVHGILQVRNLEWVAIPFSKGSFQPRDRTWISCIAGRFFIIWATRETPITYRIKLKV